MANSSRSESVGNSDTCKSCFLFVEAGDCVLIDDGTNDQNKTVTNWWIGRVMFCFGGARDPLANSLFQIINIDTGKIKIINGDEVKAIIKKTNPRIDK